MSRAQDMTLLRQHLFDQMADLRQAQEGSAEGLKAAVMKASAVGELGKVICDTAKVEVSYILATGGGESEFLNTIGAANVAPALPNGITGITRHRLAG